MELTEQNQSKLRYNGEHFFADFGYRRVFRPERYVSHEHLELFQDGPLLKVTWHPQALNYQDKIIQSN